MNSAASWWRPGGHLQTTWPALHARHGPSKDAAHISYRHECWPTPDGDFIDVDWQDAPPGAPNNAPLLVVGVSLGGNAVLRWAQEVGNQATQVASAVASISAPVDLAASGQAMGRGFNRRVYTRMFLRSMKPKAMQKLTQYPGLFSAQKLLAARTLCEFDNVFTAPLHGLKHRRLLAQSLSQAAPGPSAGAFASGQCAE